MHLIIGSGRVALRLATSRSLSHMAAYDDVGTTPLAHEWRLLKGVPRPGASRPSPHPRGTGTW